MPSRRSVLAVFLLVSRLAAAGPFDKLAARWRSRLTVIKSGRPLYTRLRLTFTAAGSFAIEEYATGGQLSWLFKGTARFTPDNELFLDVVSVTDANGAAPDNANVRYQPGESYNLGAVEYISAARVRIGSLELQKDLD